MPEENQSKTENVFEFDKLWDYNNPGETEKKFAAVLPELKNSGDKSAYLQLLTQIARTNSLRLKFDEAHKVLDEVESQLTDDLYLVLIRYNLERGRAYNSSGQTKKACDYFLKAFEFSERNGEDFYTVDAAHMLGIAEEYEKAQQWNERAMRIAEASADERTVNWLGALYNNTAWNYHDNKEYENALRLFEKNVEWHANRKSGKQLLIARWSVARALRSLNRIDEAIEKQTELLNEIEEKELEQDGYIFEELGEGFLLKGNKEESKKYFKLAYELLSKDLWLHTNEKDRLERMRQLGE